MSSEQLAASELAGYLIGVASLCRAWPNAELWGRPEEAELVAGYCEQASSLLTAPTRDGEVERLREALKPFAQYAEQYDVGGVPQKHPVVGDYRRARAALADRAGEG